MCLEAISGISRHTYTRLKGIKMKAYLKDVVLRRQHINCLKEVSPGFISPCSAAHALRVHCSCVPSVFSYCLC